MCMSKQIATCYQLGRCARIYCNDAMEPIVCCCCGNAITDSRERRKISSNAVKPVIPTLISLLREHYRGEKTDNEIQQLLLPTGSLDVYVCRQPCLNALQRYQKLQDDIKVLHANILGRFAAQYPRSAVHDDTQSKCSSVLGKHQQNCDGDLAPPTKRAKMAPTHTQPSACRRLCYGPSVPSLEPSGSPAVTTIVGLKKPVYHHITGPMKKLARLVGRGNATSIANFVFKNLPLRNKVLKEVQNTVSTEIKTICSDRHKSIFRDKSQDVLENFSWEPLWSELSSTAPVLLSILKGCIRKKADPEHTKPIICTCAAILLKLHNPKLCQFQAVISLLLHAGHASKQVYNRLQKVMLCLTPAATLNLLEQLGSSFDTPVCEWRDSLLPRVKSILAKKDAAMNEASEVLTLLANLSVHDLQESSSDDSIDDANVPEMSFDLPLVASTSSKSVPVVDESVLSSRSPTPPPPPWSPTTPSNVSPGHPIQQSSPQVAVAAPIQEPPLPIQLQFSPTSTPLTPPQQPHQHHSQETTSWKGFKIVGDNLDKTVRPRRQRFDQRTKSLHYFNAMAVQDRVDMSNFSDERSAYDSSSFSLESLLPQPDDLREITANFGILIGRVLVKHVPALKPLDSVVNQHIQHRYYKEMSSKSTVIPLGIYLKNENKLDEMVDIMDKLQEYVPTVTRTEMFELPQTGEEFAVRADYFHHIIFGGDQLTSARVRGAQRLRSNSESPKGRLTGLAPVTEDWHAKVCLLAVIWKTLLRTGSSQDVGTLVQLKHVLNRTNLPAKPKSDPNACEDFLEVVSIAHIIGACMQILGMKSIDDEPDPSIVPSGLKFKDKKKKEEVLAQVTGKIVDEFVNLSILKKTQQSTHKKADRNVDGVLEYARELLTMSLLYAEFHDSIREGDGLRILRCWRFLFLVFKAGKRKNYAIEAFTLLAQYHVLFPERMAQQLIWSRCVNMQGKPGHNIPCDLQMEHCNRLCKTAVHALGANITPKALTRIGKVSGPLLNVVHQYDSSCFVQSPSTAHTATSYEKDLKLLLKEITEHAKVFHYTPGRKHGAFKSLKGSLLKKLDWKAVQQWMEEHFEKLTM